MTVAKTKRTTKTRKKQQLEGGKDISPKNPHARIDTLEGAVKALLNRVENLERFVVSRTM